MQEKRERIKCQGNRDERPFVSKDKESNGIAAQSLEAFQFSISMVYKSYEDPQFMDFIVYEVQAYCTQLLDSIKIL